MDWLVRRCTENLLISVTICFIAGASAASHFPHPLSEQPLILLVVPLLLFPATPGCPCLSPSRRG